ncbi:MAG: ATP-binding cassette domain-containing protein, partial [Planctomycetota bacterium]
LTLDIAAGETVALVGSSGSGKTTLASLIPRFYDPEQGTVFWNDHDFRQLHLRELRRKIGIVSQRTLLFDDTVFNNIRYGATGATEEQVYEAAKQARADQFIRTKLSDGYQTVVGQGGAMLSGGQRQRIALARAILRNPDVLILDEATSQIDVESEQVIHHALKGFLKGRTTFMITHRMASLDLADKIVVMDAGRIVSVGVHAELIQTCPLYSRLRQADLRSSA